MPRRGRLHIPGGYYHVIGRGLERRAIFKRNKDKSEFLFRLGFNLSRSNAQCLAWAIMPNHYHLLIRVDIEPLAKLMSPLLTGYAGYYNKQHDRTGYVFQNRFHSILCDADAYLLELVRYIHLNPLRAGLVEDVDSLDTFPWTGHAGVLGKFLQPWHTFDEILALFGSTRRSARAAYKRFLLAAKDADAHKNLSGGGLVRSYSGWESLSRLRKEHISCIGDERILGDAAFVKSALAHDELACDLKSQLERSGWTLHKLIDAVCAKASIEPRDLRRRARRNEISKAKALICFWGVENLGLSYREIADALKISQPGVSYWVKQGKRYCDRECLVIEQYFP